MVTFVDSFGETRNTAVTNGVRELGGDLGFLYFLGYVLIGVCLFCICDDLEKAKTLKQHHTKDVNFNVLKL